MSTRKIREALDLLTEMYREQVGRKDGQPPQVRDAMAEVEAIEKAAKVVSRWGVGDVVRTMPVESWVEDLEDKESTELLMTRIAKDAP